MYRVSSKGNPWHDKLGRFCHGPNAEIDTWGNPVSDEQRQEGVKYSALTKEQYKERTLTRLKKKSNELFGEEIVYNNSGAKKYYSKNTAEDPPTAKQKRFAEAISKRLNKELPEETKKGYAEFIADNVDEFYANKPKKKPIEKPIEKPTILPKRPKPQSTLIMPTKVGKGKEGAIAFTKECATAFGVDIDNITFYSKQMGNTLGKVGGRNINGTYQVLHCTVTSKRNKTEQIHTTYHEVFHLAKNGNSEIDESKQEKQIEETMAEVSATTLCKANNIEAESTAYSEEIIKTLPRLKMAEKYRNCNTISDFGNIFINDRRNGKNISEEKSILTNQRFSEGKYFSQYTDSARKQFEESYKDICPKKYTNNESFKKEVLLKFNDGIKKLNEGKSLNKLSRNERLIVSICIRKVMEKEGVL